MWGDGWVVLGLACSLLQKGRFCQQFIAGPSLSSFFFRSCWKIPQKAF